MRSRFLNGAALAVGILLLAAGGPWLVRQIASLPKPAALAARASQLSGSSRLATPTTDDHFPLRISRSICGIPRSIANISAIVNSATAG